MLNELNLNKNLRIMDNRSIYIADDRSILTSISVFGNFRKDLIKNTGKDRIKGFLNRYGWELGQEDAESVLKYKFDSIEDAMMPFIMDRCCTE